AERLVAHAQSDALRQELDYWLAEPPAALNPLPVDYPSGIHTVASSRIVSVALDAEETRALLQQVPEAYHTQINDVLLTALAQSLSRWTGVPTWRVNLEGHGREEVVDQTNLSRTVGWFTTIFPVCLDLSDVSSDGDALKAVKEQLRRIPNRGIGYGLLRYLCADAAVREALRGRTPRRNQF